MKTFLGSDYSLVFFKLPNQLEGIVKKKKHYYSNRLGDVEPGGMAYPLPVREGKENWGRGVPPGPSNPDPLLIFLPWKETLIYFMALSYPEKRP